MKTSVITTYMYKYRAITKKPPPLFPSVLHFDRTRPLCYRSHPEVMLWSCLLKNPLMNSEAKHRSGSEGTLNGLIIVSSALVAAITTMAMVTWGGGKRGGGVAGAWWGRSLRCDLCSGKGKLRQKSGRQGLATSSGTLNSPFTGQHDLQASAWPGGCDTQPLP